MHIAPPRQFDLAPLEAFHASLRSWLVQLTAWLLEAFEPSLASPHAPAFVRSAYAQACRDLDAELRQAARQIRGLLVAHAYTRLAPEPRGFRRTRGRRPAPQRRHADRNSILRKFTAIPALKRLHAGSFSQRAARLTHMLDNTEPLIAAVLAQMTRMFARPRLAGPRIALTNDAPRALTAPCDCVASDTS